MLRPRFLPRPRPLPQGQRREQAASRRGARRRCSRAGARRGRLARRDRRCLRCLRARCFGQTSEPSPACPPASFPAPVAARRSPNADASFLACRSRDAPGASGKLLPPRRVGPSPRCLRDHASSPGARAVVGAFWKAPIFPDAFGLAAASARQNAPGVATLQMVACPPRLHMTLPAPDAGCSPAASLRSVFAAGMVAFDADSR